MQQMRTPGHDYPSEHYRLIKDEYALYIDGARVLTTPVVALLIDSSLEILVTHGDPPSVRRELAAMRSLARRAGHARFDRDWVLLEGRPALELLNAALRGPIDLVAIRQAFSAQDVAIAGRIAKELFQRLTRLPR